MRLLGMSVTSNRLAGVGIDVEAWEVAARDVDPDAVPGFEEVTGGG